MAASDSMADDPDDGEGGSSGAPVCESPTVDPALSLLVQDATALGRFGFERVLQQLVDRGHVAGQTALDLYERWWDTQNDAAHARGDGRHCDDEGGTINGFETECARQEGALADLDPFGGGLENADGYHPLALVNRFDLTPMNGANCGEYRIVYGKNSGTSFTTQAPGRSFLDRNLIIFEGVLPNPHPEQGILACRPVADFWAKLSEEPDAAARADRLEQFYFTGMEGFEPVVDPAHYGSASTSGRGTGQIRTNQFMNERLNDPPGGAGGSVTGQVWSLREYHLERVCAPAGEGGAEACTLDVKQVPVKVNPFGQLFAETSNHPLRAPFQQAFVEQVKSLAEDDLNTISMQTAPAHEAGDSPSQTTNNDYLAQGMNNTPFLQSIDQTLGLLGRSDLVAEDVLQRANAQSCAGCHEISSGMDLGGGLTWPASNGFTHIDEDGKLSDALRNVFLPHRKRVIESFLAACRRETGGAATGGSVFLDFEPEFLVDPVAGDDSRPIGGGSGVN